MNLTAIIVISIISLILLFVLLMGFWLIIYLYYIRSTAGIILFEIDSVNKKVLRFSKRNQALSTLFDAKKLGFRTFNFITLQTFFSFLDEGSRKKLNEFFDLVSDSVKTSFEIKLNPEFNTSNLTLFEKIAYLLDKSNKRLNSSYILKIKPIENKKFICTIKWEKNRLKYKFNHHNSEQSLKEFEQKNFKSNKHSVLAFAFKPYFINKEFDSIQIKSIFDNLNISISKTPFYIIDGILFIVKNKLSKFGHKKYLKMINEINDNRMINKFFLCASLINENKLNNKADRLKLINKVKFSLFNLTINPKTKSTYSNIPATITQDPKFTEFVKRLNEYVQWNNTLSSKNATIKSTNIFVYETKKASNIVINSLQKITKDDEDKYWTDFFRKIPHLNYLYEKKWYDFITQNTEKLDETGNVKNMQRLIKISQETFLQSNFILEEKKPICLIYAYNNTFDTYHLRQKISNNYKKKIPTALYIDTIDKSLINIINDTKLQAIVIGEKISKQLNNTKVFLNCFNIVNLATNNNIKTIYEGAPDYLDPLTIKKANVKISYKNDN
ncbi:MHO_4530 family protein [Mycoplasma sp. 4404]|uniref:MHO_4530 family protein n=1 Tax=Mycoplasma sp. 4404 TaxID=3108530 RepID=UPI002B1DE035|nr:hypothetical protein [Mycoplasma sp. 4404]MEA4162584.1 hypothetical protein [Mycoplasma sp. 4404]